MNSLLNMLPWVGWGILVLVLEALLVRTFYATGPLSPVFSHVIGKFTSGRWLCTMGAVLAFLWMIKRQMITQDQALMVINNVFLFYFLRAEKKEETG